MIERSNPDVGYISPDTFNAIRISQVVKANGLVHYSGIVAAGPDGSCVAPGDAARQITWILEILLRLLKEENLTMSSLISTTVFTTDIDTISNHMQIFSEAFDESPPTSTWVEVKRLGHPDYILELVAIAAI
ncbi:MAG: Rid family hydrolase [Sphingomonadaceae bacterium]